MAYTWPEFPCSGSQNFEYNARFSLETWRLNGIDIEKRLDEIESGAAFAPNTIDGDVIMINTLNPDRLEAGNLPVNNYVPTYNASSGLFDWKDMEGVVGGDTYQVKYNDSGSPMFLEGHMATEQEVIDGTREDKLISPATINAIMNVIFQPGMIAAFANTTQMAGWLLCDGNAVSRVQYSALFNVIGTIYGAGNGSTTFNLPDLRDMFVRGLSDDRNIGSFQDSDNKSHAHSVGQVGGSTNTTGDHIHTFTGSFQGDPAGGMYIATDYRPADTGNVNTAGNHSHSVTVNAHNTRSVGSADAHPKNIAMPFYIKY